jgi:hypothetical protein
LGILLKDFPILEDRADIALAVAFERKIVLFGIPAILF